MSNDDPRWRNVPASFSWLLLLAGVVLFCYVIPLVLMVLFGLALSFLP